MTTRKPPVESFSPKTLGEAHELIPKMMPDPRTASLEEWVAFRRRSAAMYARVADVDRGHHHEALYWAERELQVVEELLEQIKARTAGSAGAGGAS